MYQICFLKVLTGKKVFLLLPPTEGNMKLYEKWLCSRKCSDTFFLDMVCNETEEKFCDSEVSDLKRKKIKVEQCIKVTLQEDQTLIIPSGWIHAVYTPLDTIVIGGNFLHGLDIKKQLAVYSLETRTRVPAKFRFPQFVRLMFYAGIYYFKKMKHKTSFLCKAELDELNALIDALRVWAIRPEGKVNVIGSLAHTIEECIETLQKCRGIKNVNQMLITMEDELEQILREDKKSKKLTISSQQNVCQSSKVYCPQVIQQEVKVKPKIRLKLGNKKGVNPTFTIKLSKASFTSSTESQPSSLVKITKKKHKIVDISSYRGEIQNDDDEWFPGKKQKKKKREKSINVHVPDIEPNIKSFEVLAGSKKKSSMPVTNNVKPIPKKFKDKTNQRKKLYSRQTSKEILRKKLKF